MANRLAWDGLTQIQSLIAAAHLSDQPHLMPLAPLLPVSRTTVSLPVPLTLSFFIWNLTPPPPFTWSGWPGLPSPLALPWKWICSWTFSRLSRFFAWYCTSISKPPSCLSTPVHLAEWFTSCLVLYWHEPKPNCLWVAL